MDTKPKVVNSEIFQNQKGILIAFNEFSLLPIKRLYSIIHPNSGIVKAWQGHKIENKWFYVIEGSFAIAWVEIDDFENPSSYLHSDYKVIQASENVVLHIPKGYANGIKALKSNSRVLVFSDLSLVEAKNDNFKYDSENWLNWDKL
ncbi:hypothetical protein [Aquiflexum sp.]|uniref:hypothetical protein n=1 Tax=Aquiflexum sp. TaxID=1872584 RepID=UPI003593A144